MSLEKTSVKFLIWTDEGQIFIQVATEKMANFNSSENVEPSLDIDDSSLLEELICPSE